MTKVKQEAKRAAEPTARCELCNREKPLTEHHLIPKAVHSKKRFLRRHGKKEMQSRKLMLCKLCHKGVHELIPDEKDLAESFNTREALLTDPRIVEHVKWVRKQK